MSIFRSLVRFVLAPLSFAVVCFSLWLSLNASGSSRPAAVDESAIHYADLLGDNPIKIQPEPVQVDLPINCDELARYAALVATAAPDDPEMSARARLIHVARLWRFVPSLPIWLERDDLGRVSRVLIGAPAFSPSWRGLDIVEQANGRLSEHRDQLLCTLAESGVPLNAAIDIGAEQYTVRDFLRTSMNEFHLKQRELEWTAVAYAYYLPPQSRWRNRLGEEYSFDELADELMERPLTAGSCQGIHLVTSLTTILLCDEETPVLSDDTRDRIARHLSRYVDGAVASQQADGLWPLRWAPEGFFNDRGHFTPAATLDGRVVVSGHLLEWFHWLPKKLKPPEATIRSGLVALSRQLEASPPELVVQEFCPYTHAVAALFLAGSP